MKHVKTIIFVTSIVFLLTSCSTSSFFYYPNLELVETPDTTKYEYENVNFPSNNGRLLNGWFIKPKGKKDIIGTILHFHGNASNISYQYRSVLPLIDAGFQAFVFDYQGYGKSEGKPSQEKVLEDGTTALLYLKQLKDVKDKPLILFGQSLGGHLSTIVTNRNQSLIDALVIEAAFTGHEKIAVDIGKRYYLPGFFTKTLVRTKYNAIDEIESIKIPKLIIHSTEDKVVPFYMGEELFAKAGENKEFWKVNGPHIAVSRLYTKEFTNRFLNLVK